MNSKVMRRVGAACVSLCLLGFAGISHAAPSEETSIGQLSGQQVEVARSDQRLVSLSRSEQDAILRIAADPRFGVPGYERELMDLYPEVEVDLTTGSTLRSPAVSAAQISPMAKGNRVWVTMDWKIAGVKYASITTQANYDNNGARVTKVNSCWNTSSNFLPGIRSVDGNSYSSLSRGILTCKTDWVAKFIMGRDKRVTQGFRVTGNGTFLEEWPK